MAPKSPLTPLYKRGEIIEGAFYAETKTGAD